MRVTICLFGHLRERVGRSRLSVEVPPGATAREAILAAVRETAVPPELIQGARAAVNLEYTTDAQVLREGDEVAVIPPVSGG